jgi:hypothetical protein
MSGSDNIRGFHFQDRKNNRLRDYPGANAVPICSFLASHEMID